MKSSYLVRHLKTSPTSWNCSDLVSAILGANFLDCSCCLDAPISCAIPDLFQLHPWFSTRGVLRRP